MKKSLLSLVLIGLLSNSLVAVETIENMSTRAFDTVEEENIITLTEEVNVDTYSYNSNLFNISQNNKLLATKEADNIIRILDLKSREVLTTIDTSEYDMPIGYKYNNIFFTPDNNFIFYSAKIDDTNTYAEDILFFNISTGKMEKKLSFENLQWFKYLPNENELIVAFIDDISVYSHSLNFYDINSGDLKKKITGTSFVHGNFIFTNDNKIITTTSNEVQVHDVNSENKTTLLNELELDTSKTGSIIDIKLKDNESVYILSYNQLDLWNFTVDTLETIVEFNTKSNGHKFIPNTNKLISYEKDINNEYLNYVYKLYGEKIGKLEIVLSPNKLIFSADNTKMLYSNDSEIQIFDASPLTGEKGASVTPTVVGAGYTEEDLKAEYNDGYQAGLNASKGETNTTNSNLLYSQEDLDTKYEEGKEYCKNNPKECGMTTSSSEITTNNQLTESTIDNLPSGWNLVGTSYYIGDYSIFNNTDTIWTYKDNSWKSYKPSKSSMIPPSIEIGEFDGFWLKK